MNPSWEIDLSDEFVILPPQMPNAPKRPCPTPGCRHFQPCEVHVKPKFVDTKTVDERKFYSSYAWQKLRDRHIRDEPLCRQHAQSRQYVPAEVVDHIVAIRDGGEPMDDANLQSMCWPCHQAKRRFERQAREKLEWIS